MMTSLDSIQAITWLLTDSFADTENYSQLSCSVAKTGVWNLLILCCDRMKLRLQYSGVTVMQSYGEPQQRTIPYWDKTVNSVQNMPLMCRKTFGT